MSPRLTVRASSVVLALTASSFAPATANAQWTAASLMPPDAYLAYASSGRANQQVGVGVLLSDLNKLRAGLWSGTAESWVDLHPQGFVVSYGVATDGVQQVGYGYDSLNSQRACLWSGTAASFIDLHQEGRWTSKALGVDSGQQVGFVGADEIGFVHAALWLGSAASLINLNPPGAESSALYGVHAGRQVGAVDFVTSPLGAAMWTGTAESFQSLHPPGALWSYARGIRGDQQVGDYGIQSTFSSGACLWQSTAESWVDLHPIGASESFAVATNGEWQVGWYRPLNNGIFRACLWHGTRESFVDIAEFLPPGYIYSQANDVWVDAGSLFVVGSASGPGQNETPFLWSRPLAPQDRCVEATQTDTWLETDGAADDFLGWSVAISGDTAVMGAYRDDDGGSSSGSAYVYTRTEGVWVLQQKLTASDAASNDQFGFSVAISGDTIVVGAQGDDNAGGTDAGAAYVFTRPAGGSTWTQLHKLLASDRQAGDQFGYSVSIDGGRMAIGAQGDDDEGSAAGSAYVFIRTGGAGGTWSQEVKLTASDGGATDLFGQAVAISRNTVVVGAFGEDTNPGNLNRGAAYIFVESGGLWTQQAKLIASDAAASDLFGVSVAIDVNTAVIGANSDDLPGATDAGSAYVFIRENVGFPPVPTWSQQQKLTASDAVASDFFGSSVSLADSRVVVGASGADTAGGSGAGAAYMFGRNGTVWTQDQKVVAADGAAGDGFGKAVALSSTTALVGASGDDTPDGAQAGSGHVFTLSAGTWSQQAKLVASAGSTSDFYPTYAFGGKVVISGDRAVVALPARASAAGDDVGAVYVFERSAGGVWLHQATLTASDGATLDRFGTSVAMDGDMIVVGASAADTAFGINAGAAYVFIRSSNGSWTQLKLFPSDGGEFHQFGEHVAVSGNVVAIAAPGDDLSATGSEGSVYLYARTPGWVLQDKVRASDAASGYRFGRSLALSNETLVVGRFSDPPAVYVFERSPGGSDWIEQDRLSAPAELEMSSFGESLALAGDTLVVGSPSTQVAGAVVTFTRTGTLWTPHQVFTCDSASATGAFGTSCGFDGQTLVVGDYGAGTPEVHETGAAYLFTRSEHDGLWAERAVLTMPAAVRLSRFGYSVGVSGDDVLVSAPGDETPGAESAGSVHLYQISTSSYSPAITSHPVSTAACSAGDASFSVAAAGTPPLTYQWQLETVPGSDNWINVTNGVMPGIGTFDISLPEVMVAVAITGGLSLTTRCIVTNDCGSATSDEAALNVCIADFNCDGIRAVPDIFAFLAAWFAQSPSADVDGIPGLGVPDIFAFLSAWFAGCD